MKETVERQIVQSILSTVLVATARLAVATLDLGLNALQLGLERFEPLGGVRLREARRSLPTRARLRLGRESHEPLLGCLLPREVTLTVRGPEPALTELQGFGAANLVELRGGAGVCSLGFPRSGSGELRGAYRFGEGFALRVARSLA